MSGINDDYTASWDMLERAWHDLDDHDSKNQGLQYWDPITKKLRAQDVAEVVWTKQKYLDTHIGLLHLLTKYTDYLTSELSRLRRGQSAPA